MKSMYPDSANRDSSVRIENFFGSVEINVANERLKMTILDKTTYASVTVLMSIFLKDMKLRPSKIVSFISTERALPVGRLIDSVIQWDKEIRCYDYPFAHVSWLDDNERIRVETFIVLEQTSIYLPYSTLRLEVIAYEEANNKELNIEISVPEAKEVVDLIKLNRVPAWDAIMEAMFIGQDSWLILAHKWKDFRRAQFNLMGRDYTISWPSCIDKHINLILEKVHGSRIADIDLATPEYRVKYSGNTVTLEVPLIQFRSNVHLPLYFTHEARFEPLRYMWGTARVTVPVLVHANSNISLLIASMLPYNMIPAFLDDPYLDKFLQSTPTILDLIVLDIDGFIKPREILRLLTLRPFRSIVIFTVQRHFLRALNEYAEELKRWGTYLLCRGICYKGDPYEVSMSIVNDLCTMAFDLQKEQTHYFSSRMIKEGVLEPESVAWFTYGQIAVMSTRERKWPKGGAKTFEKPSFIDGAFRVSFIGETKPKEHEDGITELNRSPLEFVPLCLVAIANAYHNWNPPIITEYGDMLKLSETELWKETGYRSYVLPILIIRALLWDIRTLVKSISPVEISSDTRLRTLTDTELTKLAETIVKLWKKLPLPLTVISREAVNKLILWEDFNTEERNLLLQFLKIDEDHFFTDFALRLSMEIWKVNMLCFSNPWIIESPAYIVPSTRESVAKALLVCKMAQNFGAPVVIIPEPSPGDCDFFAAKILELSLLRLAQSKADPSKAQKISSLLRERFNKIVPEYVRQTLSQFSSQAFYFLNQHPEVTFEPFLEELLDRPVLRISAPNRLQLSRLLLRAKYAFTQPKREKPRILFIIPDYSMEDFDKMSRPRDHAAYIQQMLNLVRSGIEHSLKPLEGRTEVRILSVHDEFVKDKIEEVLGMGWDFVVFVGEGGIRHGKPCLELPGNLSISINEPHEPNTVDVQRLQVVNGVVLLLSCSNSLNLGDYTDLASELLQAGAVGVIGSILPLSVNGAENFIKKFLNELIFAGRPVPEAYWLAKQALKDPLDRFSLILSGVESFGHIWRAMSIDEQRETRI